jgi:hypothetical protein
MDELDIKTPEELEGEETGGEEGSETTQEESPPPPPPPPDPEIEQWKSRAERAEQEREREREMFKEYIAKINPGQPAQKQEDDPDKALADVLAMADEPTQKLLLKYQQALDRRYATRNTVDEVRQVTGNLARTSQEREAQEALRAKGVPDDDIKAIRTSIDKLAQQGRKWDSPMSAYKEIHHDMMMERQYDAAESAAAKKAALDARQAKQATPTGAAPTGSGKIKLSVKDIRAKAGRRLSTYELAQEVEKAQS